MKRLISLSLILFSAHYLYANASDDTITSGNVGLIVPSTSARDNSRALSDKFNQDFKIVASTLGTHEDRLNNVAVATGAITTSLTPNIVTSTNVKDGTLQGFDLAASVLTSTSAGNSVWTGANIASNTITGKNIQSGTAVQLSSAEFSGLVSVSSFNSIGTIASTSGFTVGASTVNGNLIATAYYGSGANLTGIASGGGGVNESTYTRQIGVGGDVSISSGVFVAFPGKYVEVKNTTQTILGYQPYCENMSSASVTMRISSRTTSNSFTYVTPDIILIPAGVTTGSRYGTWVSTTLVFNDSTAYSLHFNLVSSTVPPAQNCGLMIRRKDGLDNLP